MSNTYTATLVEYTAAALAIGGSMAPNVTISGLNYPWGIAFDTRGSLWVANSNQNSLEGTIVEYTAAQLTSSGTLVPAVTLTPPGVLPSPTGIAFDNSGNLWYIDIDNFSIREIAAARLASTGSPPAAVILTNTLGGVALAFNPHSPNLWLH